MVRSLGAQSLLAMLGAAGWLWVMRTTGYELGFLTLAIAWAVGWGGRWLAKDKSNPQLGVWAACFTGLALIAAKGGLTYLEIAEEPNESARPIRVLNQEQAVQILAERMQDARKAAGNPQTWPEMVVTETTRIPDRYPRQLWQEAEQAFDALDAEGQARLRQPTDHAGAEESLVSRYWRAYLGWFPLWLCLACAFAARMAFIGEQDRRRMLGLEG